MLNNLKKVEFKKKKEMCIVQLQKIFLVYNKTTLMIIINYIMYL